MQRNSTELHELPKHADIRRRRADLIPDEELKRLEADNGNDEKNQMTIMLIQSRLKQSKMSLRPL